MDVPFCNTVALVLMHDSIGLPSSGYFGDIHWPIPVMQALSLEH